MARRSSGSGSLFVRADSDGRESYYGAGTSAGARSSAKSGRSGPRAPARV